MNNYFRITGYHPQADFCFIIDSNGLYEKRWQFSSELVQKGLKIIDISGIENFIDINIGEVEIDKDHIMLRAIAKGKPESTKAGLFGTLLTNPCVGQAKAA